MNRRRLLQLTLTAIASAQGLGFSTLAPRQAKGAVRSVSRVRPGNPGWPSEESWNALSSDAGSRLIKVHSPFAACASAPTSAECTQIFKELKNPYYLGDEVGLTQGLGWVDWVDAWTSQPSVYAVAAHTTNDVVAAVNFRATTICGWS